MGIKATTRKEVPDDDPGYVKVRNTSLEQLRTSYPGTNQADNTAVDQRCRHDIPSERPRLQIVDPYTLPTSLLREQNLPVPYLGNDVLRHWIPPRQYLHPDLRLFAPPQVLASRHPRSLHQLYKSRSRLRIHEYHLRSHHLHPAAADRLAAKALTKRKSRCLGYIPQWSNVRPQPSAPGTSLISRAQNLHRGSGALRLHRPPELSQCGILHLEVPSPFPLLSATHLAKNRLTHTNHSIMEINIGVMCSCMPALRPLFGRIIPKLSIHSIRSKLSRTRYHQGSSEQAEEGGAIIEMEPYRRGGLEANENANENEDGSASTGRSPTVESGGDAGVRNIVAF